MSALSQNLPPSCYKKLSPSRKRSEYNHAVFLADREGPKANGKSRDFYTEDAVAKKQQVGKNAWHLPGFVYNGGILNKGILWKNLLTPN